MAVRETLYLVCGLISDETVWKHQSGLLAEILDVRIAKFPGYNSISRMAEQIVTGAPKCFSIAGHSMGGRVALEVCRLVGERISKLVLLDTGIYPAHEHEAKKCQALIDIAREHGMKVMAKEWVPTIIHPDRLDDAELVNELSEMAQRNTPEQFTSHIKALLERPDMRELLPGINCRTLVCCGRQDAWTPVRQHIEMASKIKGAKLEIIENSGHMTMMEQPRQVSNLMYDWMKE